MADNDQVPVLGPDGAVLGHFQPLGYTEEEIAIAKKRAASDGPWYSGEQVQRHLQALERALADEGSLDEDRVRQVLEEARARDHSS